MMLSIGKTCVPFAYSTCPLNVRIQNYVSEAKSRGWFTLSARRQAAMSKKREHARRRALLEKFKNEVPLIQCKNPELNHYRNATYARFVPLPLASNGWYHRKSAGDYFTIYNKTPTEKETLKEPKEDEIKIPNLMRMSDFGFTNEEGKKDPVGIQSFSELNLNPDLVKAVERMNIKKPSEIQEQGIPIILSGRNVVLTAHTGCGKTLAFLLPLIQLILHWKRMNLRPKQSLDAPFVLIISPSRELAVQTHAVAKALTNDINVIPKLIIGGQTNQSIKVYDHSEVDIVIGSLGGLSKFITRGVILLDHLKSVVLDEADTLLDENFSDKLVGLLQNKIMVRPNRSSDDQGVQLIMVGATMPETLPERLSSVIPLESLVEVSTEEADQLLPSVKQKFIRVNHSMRASLLLDLVMKDINRGDSVIIFR